MRFTDLAKNDPNRAIVGLMARAGILPGVTPTTFVPQAPVTNGQMSFALKRFASLSRVPPASPIKRFADNISTTGSTPVNRASLAKTLAASRLPTHALAISPAASLTREEAAVTLYQAIAATQR